MVTHSAVMVPFEQVKEEGLRGDEAGSVSFRTTNWPGKDME